MDFNHLYQTVHRFDTAARKGSPTLSGMDLKCYRPIGGNFGDTLHTHGVAHPSSPTCPLCARTCWYTASAPCSTAAMTVRKKVVLALAW